ncbi:MAG: aminopeptidase, partial [Lysobacter sp.]|nr:aminopeptidase [Lysobacter sp.]
MRTSILTVCLVAALTVAAGCSRDAAPAADASKTTATPEAKVTDTAVAAADRDEHSYAQPDLVRIDDLALLLAVDFASKTLTGSATYTLQWTDP